MVLLSATIFGGADAIAESGAILFELYLNSEIGTNEVRIRKFPGYSDNFVPGEDSEAPDPMSGHHHPYSWLDNKKAEWDFRSEDCNTPFHLKFACNETIEEGSEPNIILEFSYPLLDYTFGDETITLTQEDADGNNIETGYRGDARAEINYGGGLAAIDFGKLPAGSYTENTPFLHLRIDFDKLLADLNGDGIVNLKDYAIAANYWKKQGRHISDISGPNDVPDKKVDYWDLSAFCGDYLKEE